MENKLIVVGIGPGSKDYILPAAMEAIENAAVLAGGRRALSGFAVDRQKQIVIGADIESAVNEIRRFLSTDEVVVMVSGDPGFHSFLVRMKKEFSHIEVIPGISSLQMAFARIAVPWQGAEFLSLHGQDIEDEKLRHKAGRNLGFLTDGNNRPENIAKRLLATGWPPAALCYVCSDLSYDTECIEKGALGEIATGGNQNCVMVVLG